MQYVSLFFDIMSYIGLAGMIVFGIYSFFDKDSRMPDNKITTPKPNWQKTREELMDDSYGVFNCPGCGSHDYGLFATQLGGECVWCLKSERDALQAKVDSLMLEHCPEEMTDVQKERWAKHQVPGNG